MEIGSDPDGACADEVGRDGAPLVGKIDGWPCALKSAVRAVIV